MGQVFWPESRFQRPYCRAGHYKPEVGVRESNGYCWVCNVNSEARRNVRVRSRRSGHLPPDQFIGPQLEELRTFFGWSAYRMAQELQVDKRSYLAWTKGISRYNYRPVKTKGYLIERMKPQLARLFSLRNSTIHRRQTERAERERFFRGSGMGHHRDLGAA